MNSKTAYMREWRKRNPERSREIQKRYCIKNKITVDNMKRIYYQENKTLILAKASAYRKANPDKTRTQCVQYGLNRRMQLRNTLLAHYGGNECSRCGFNDTRGLHLHHINGDGNATRRGHKWNSYFESVIKDDFKEQLEVLCANCHAIETWHTKFGR